MLALPAPRALAVIEALLIECAGGAVAGPAYVAQQLAVHLHPDQLAAAASGGSTGTTAEAPTLATWGTSPEAQAGMRAMEQLLG